MNVDSVRSALLLSASPIAIPCNFRVKGYTYSGRESFTFEARGASTIKKNKRVLSSRLADLILKPGPQVTIQLNECNFALRSLR